MVLAVLVGSAVVHTRSAGASDERREFNKYAFYNWDENDYLDLNPDLESLRACADPRVGEGSNAPLDCVEQHFLRHGRDEGRATSFDFDPAVYREVNGDLAGLGNRALYLHYNDGGFAEGRVSSLCDGYVFNFYFYRTTYPDLAALNETQLCQHYRTYGLAQGRQGSGIFSVARYRQLNPDLSGSGRDLALHYLRYGRAENRPTV